MSVPPARGDRIIIVGSGVFGVSLALELQKRKYTDLTILDRFLPPVADASSTDANRIIRPDYADPFYAQLATEAINEWRNNDLYKIHYHPTGFALVSEQERDDFLEGFKAVARRQGNAFVEFASTEELIKLRPELRDMRFPFQGYLSQNAGWADAAGATRAVAERCSALGVSFITGPRGTVVSLRRGTSGEVLGVNVASGPPLSASRVILATGAWTSHLVDVDQVLTASAQPVGFVQLTEEEARRLAPMPVVDNMTTGCFVFPPTPGTNVLKIARHGHGFEVNTPAVGQTARAISAPQVGTNNAKSSWIPEDAARAFRVALKQLVPCAAEKPWLRLRLCWYTETRKGDFIADHHPTTPGLFIATGGSGHGFKFLPVLGKYMADCFEGTADQDVREKWALKAASSSSGPIEVSDGSRRGPPRRMLTVKERSRL